MIRLILLAASLVVTNSSCFAYQEASEAEQFLHSGEFANGETQLLLKLDAEPENDEARFGLGVVHFMRAIENLGQAMYEYGAVSEKANQPFLRLPVPRNENPSVITYRALGRVLDAFANDLQRAERTLAKIRDPDVKLRLRLSKIAFDFSGKRQERTQLIDILTKINGGPFQFQKDNPEFRVHFDRGDVAWLRAYCHLLSAMVEAYRSVDEEAGFGQRVETVFPNVNVEPVEPGVNWWEEGLAIVDPPRLRRMRLHLVAVCELNRETWKFIRQETDDDFEWIPDTDQTDQLGLPLNDEQIDAWLAMMAQSEGLLKGEILIPGFWVQFLGNQARAGHGLNIRKVFDDPPNDLFNMTRIQEQGIADKYFDLLEGKQNFNINAFFQIGQAFGGPFGFARAIRLN